MFFSLSKHAAHIQEGTTAIKRGFDVGSIEELMDQARHGGVRLPGRYRVKRGERCVYTDPEYDMKDLVRSNDIIRLGNSGGFTGL